MTTLRDQPPVGRNVQIATLLLVALSASVFTAIDADLFPGASIACLALLVTVAVAGSVIDRVRPAGTASRVVLPALVAAGLSAFGWEVVSRWWLGTGRPLELIIMAALRNVVIGLGLLSARREYQSITILLTMFLAMFGATSASERMAQALAGAYAAVAILWLLATHWDGVRQRLTARGATSRVAWRSPAVIITAVLVVLFGATFSGRPLARAVRGFLPSSGGDGDSSDYARAGIGDGEMLVAGAENIQSFGPIEDAPFMTDDRPSLYDVFDDSYEEPVRPNQSQDRAVALGSDVDVRRSKEHIHTETQKAQHEFSTRRKPPGESRPGGIRSITSNALFHVAGRVPLHLRMERYDTFDGVDWSAADSPEAAADAAPIVQIGGKPWLKLPDRGKVAGELAQAETHALKIVRMETNMIPSPPNLHGVHIDHVDRPDMYQVEPGPRVRLQRKALPELVPIHVASRTIDPEQARAAIIFETLNSESTLPESLDAERWRALAGEWTRGCRSRAEMAAAIERRLQTEFIHDPLWRAPADAASPVEEFLFVSRRGPDYLFATAAALLLRALHFDAQVTGGFYANPAEYDFRSRHTPVHARDAHFWVEARLAGGGWMTIEPTPGFARLLPRRTWLQQLQAAGAALLALAGRHWLALEIGAMLLVVAVMRRRRWADAFDEIIWRCWPRRRTALRALTLLERRADRFGMSRKPGEDVRRWLSRLTDSGPARLSREASRFCQSVDAAAFSAGRPDEECEHQEADVMIERLSHDWFERRIRPRDSRRESTRIRGSLIAAALLLLLGLPVAISGCGAAHSDDGRLEHEHPAHKPESFQAAVSEIERRSTDSTLEGNAVARQELDDILNWIPELAADTSLGKAEWDEAVAAARALQKWRSTSNQARPTPPPAEPLEQLQRLSAAAGN